MMYAQGALAKSQDWRKGPTWRPPSLDGRLAAGASRRLQCARAWSTPPRRPTRPTRPRWRRESGRTPRGSARGTWLGTSTEYLLLSRARSQSDRAMLSAMRLCDSAITVSWKATSAAWTRGMSSRDVRICSRVCRAILEAARRCSARSPRIRADAVGGSGQSRLEPAPRRRSLAHRPSQPPSTGMVPGPGLRGARRASGPARST